MQLFEALVAVYRDGGAGAGLAAALGPQLALVGEGDVVAAGVAAHGGEYLGAGRGRGAALLLLGVRGGAGPPADQRGGGAHSSAAVLRGHLALAAAAVLWGTWDAVICAEIPITHSR